MKKETDSSDPQHFPEGWQYFLLWKMFVYIFQSKPDTEEWT